MSFFSSSLELLVVNGLIVVIAVCLFMQDDEYLASLQADRERELKEAEAAREEERRIAEESRRKLLEEQVMQL